MKPMYNFNLDNGQLDTQFFKINRLSELPNKNDFCNLARGIKCSANNFAIGNGDLHVTQIVI